MAMTANPRRVTWRKAVLEAPPAAASGASHEAESERGTEAVVVLPDAAPATINLIDSTPRMLASATRKRAGR